ncbi:hypothetical protein KJ912_03725, partial [Patescibacteria group bacterium]|nr:hypothetical protein [Patescibacteria group bacterium]
DDLAEGTTGEKMGLTEEGEKMAEAAKVVVDDQAGEEPKDAVIPPRDFSDSDKNQIKELAIMEARNLIDAEKGRMAGAKTDLRGYREIKQEEDELKEFIGARAEQIVATRMQDALIRDEILKAKEETRKTGGETGPEGAETIKQAMAKIARGIAQDILAAWKEEKAQKGKQEQAAA